MKINLCVILQELVLLRRRVQLMVVKEGLHENDVLLKLVQNLLGPSALLSTKHLDFLPSLDLCGIRVF